MTLLYKATLARYAVFLAYVTAVLFFLLKNRSKIVNILKKKAD